MDGLISNTNATWQWCRAQTLLLYGVQIIQSTKTSKTTQKLVKETMTRSLSPNQPVATLQHQCLSLHRTQAKSQQAKVHANSVEGGSYRDVQVMSVSVCYTFQYLKSS